MARARNAPVQNIPVHPADGLRATHGANMGDPLSFAAELVLDDIYELAPDSAVARLALVASSTHDFRIAAGSEVGSPGARLFLDCALSFMCPDGRMTEALLIVEVDDRGDAAGSYLLPLAPLAPRTEYRLVGIDTENPLRTFAQVACVSFARGTRITLSSGLQRPIEDLSVGDAVLTRDDGPQRVRWIGQNTVRAVGEFAPVLIAAGALNNAHDLLVSPDHRLFIYQRSDEVGAGRAELLVKARHLVNGDSVRRVDGGFVDYFQLLFDDHQIIYAEGIAAESLLVDPRTRAALPEEVGGDAHAHRHHLDYEVQERLLSGSDAVALLRKASSS